MANIRLITRRIRSAKNIAQITKAMELVAASKMKKAQEAAVSGKLYAQKMREVVNRLARTVTTSEHPLLKKSPKATTRRLVILISTNKGLCGGLNTSLFRFAFQEYQEFTGNAFISLGQKGTSLLVQARASITADFSQNLPFVSSVPALTQLAIDKYLEGELAGVDIVFNDFISALKYEPRRKIILPLSLEKSEITPETTSDLLIEPSKEEVFEKLLPHFVENQIREAILEAEASEHSARMVAMRSATDNALSFMEQLTLLYNRARQEKITYEISDMVTARMAVDSGQ